MSSFCWSSSGMSVEWWFILSWSDTEWFFLDLAACEVWSPSGLHSYINDLCNIPLSPGTKLMLFADDIMLFKPISVSHDAALFQADVNLVNDWVSNNHLTIKTKFMLISRQCKLPKNFPPIALSQQRPD